MSSAFIACTEATSCKTRYYNSLVVQLMMLWTFCETVEQLLTHWSWGNALAIYPIGIQIATSDGYAER